MNGDPLDIVTTQLAVGSRRRALTGLASLAIGGAGVLTQTMRASADGHTRCMNRCVGHIRGTENLNKKRHRCRQTCRRR